MRKYYILNILLLPIYLFGQAQHDDSLIMQPKQKWIENMNQYIMLKIILNSDIETLAVVTDQNKIQLSPNAKSISRISFSYKFISFSIKYIPKFLPGNDDDDIRGKTKGGGFGMNFNFNHWQQELSYSKTQGYYLENTSDYNTAWKPGDPYIQFPELVYNQYQGTTAYNFNPKFSVSAVTSQTQRQLKSAGSFIPILRYRYYIVDDRSTPQSGRSTQKTNNFEIILGAGYYHTFVIRNNFYFSLGLTPGAGFVYTRLTTRYPSGDVSTDQRNAIFRLDGWTGLGYNGQRFFTGFYMQFSGSSFNQEHTSAISENSKVAIQGFVGYRLNAPKWMKEKVESVNNIIRTK
ncbi:DUF4421 family protein [Flavihumibacter profundi]|uniref:DUF4421 family protein n=1 Tax=Flavihumibacter profundi TaxID=2716883 RepID=UPI001CC3AEF6|nr:DUF4421 family protein [Flavihumibacter profundi]MBZ5855627.1 DUF4421 domain-containing protein [Flavihumibacter profundi]